MNHTRILRSLALPVALCAALVFVASASAAYEQVGCFAGTVAGLANSCKPVAEEKFGEEVQLGGTGGMAVNYTGAGGVPKGTVYVIGNGPEVEGGISSFIWVAMYTPKADGGLAFNLKWRVTGSPGGPYTRCGPALGTACVPAVKDLPVGSDVDIDQATGNVYVYDTTTGLAGHTLFYLYTPDGASEIAHFGKGASGGEATSEHPDEVHGLSGHSIAVDNTGAVYSVDANDEVGFYHRLMVFKPETPGDYEHYAYAGEVLANSKPVTNTSFPALDDQGNIYAASDEEVKMFPPQIPAPYPAPIVSPICSYKFGKAGIKSLTVNPQSGEVFFWSYKLPKRVRRLGPCDPSTGKFTEIAPEPEALTVSPERDDLWALAFDPVRQLSPGRAPGVLYGAAPAPVPTEAVGVGEPGQSSLGYVFAHTEEIPPEIITESIAHVTSTEAILRATIDPHGFNTEYRFQYLTQAAFEANPSEDPFAGAAELGGAIPAAQGGRNVSEAIAGLSPDTAYRYRVIVTSHCSTGEPGKECVDKGGARPFRTYALLGNALPDGRAWELVSPAQKNGGQVLPVSVRVDSCHTGCKPGEGFVRFPVQSAPVGNAVAYEGTPFALGEGGDRENQYVSHRDPASGWSTENPTPALFSRAARSEYSALDSELRQAILWQSSPTLSPLAPNDPNLYSQALTDPAALAPLLVEGAEHRSAEEFQVRFAGGSSDLSRVFFEANDTLTEEAPGVAPAPEDGGAKKVNLYEWERASGAVRLVNVLPGNAASAAGASFGNAGAHAISTDGSRAFYSDEAGQVYLREDAATTVAVPGSGKGAGFLAAATDGSRVLLSNGQLYDFGTAETTDLTGGQGGFAGLSGQSDDLGHVYFVDTKILTETPNGEGKKSQDGTPNLYAWKEGSISFVGTLVPADNESSWNPIPSKRTAKASPSGRFITFSSLASLTAYDNTGPCKVVASGPPEIYGPGPCREVYLYDSATEELRCPSCNPSEATPINVSTLPIVDGPARQAQPNYISDSGRLFFDSQDSLSPFDTNNGVEDAYEYEPAGVGSCQRAEGCVSLISAGTGNVDSNFLAADADGANVFFTTRNRLVPRDSDELIDVYDARVGGGLAIDYAVPPPGCQGAGCQQAAASPPALLPSSATLSDPGNVKQTGTQCKKPKVRRNGRCIKKPQQHHRKHNQKHPHRVKGGVK